MATIAEALAVAVGYHRAGDLRQAESIYRQVLQSDPAQADALHLMGLIAARKRRHDLAVDYYRKAIRSSPAIAPFHFDLGMSCRALGMLDEAIACFQQAVHLQPDYPDCHNSLGNALAEQGKLEEAAASLREALRWRPDLAEAYSNLGAVLAEQGKPEEALACLDQALRLRPDFGEAHSNIGAAQADLGRRDEALASYAQALRLLPDYIPSHVNRALLWLMRGEFERGWPEYEWRLRVGRPATDRYPPQCAWDGSPLAGRTILLYAEQGLGDTLQFVRYAPRVKERGGLVIVECQAALVRLLSGCRGIDRLAVQGSTLPACDVQAPLLSLPGIFRPDRASIPAEVPYLRPEPGLVQRWRHELHAHRGFKIGLAWQGSRTNARDYYRSIPLHRFLPLAKVEGVRWFSMQKEPGAEQVESVADRFPMCSLGSRLVSFMDTAACLASLDLVITVDTALAHCAGALGVPTWVLVPFVPDWRWLLDSEESPWYPSMRLWRQPAPGRWDDVIARIAAELKRLPEIAQ